MKVQLPVLISSIATKKDGSVKIGVETRELPPNEMAIVFELRNQEAWALFATSGLKEADIPDEKPDSMTGQKTQAQRLRASIYRLWEQRGKPGDSETFYRTQLERIIDRVKEELD